MDSAPRETHNKAQGMPDMAMMNQYEVEGQILTDDEHLKDRVKSLQQHDVLILRGDRADSLVFKSESLNE